MPALPSVQFNWQTASLFIAFTLLIVVILMATMNTFQVATVKLEGAQRVTAADVTPGGNGQRQIDLYPRPLRRHSRHHHGLP